VGDQDDGLPSFGDEAIEERLKAEEIARALARAAAHAR